MRLMLWSMDLHHRAARFLLSPDYVSRLGADLEFDEMSRLYLSKTVEICKLYPPISGTMRPENMPGYRASRIHSDLAADASTTPANTGAASLVDATIAPILTSILFGRSGGHEYCLETLQIVTGHLSIEKQKSLHHIPLYTHEIPVLAAASVAFLLRSTASTAGTS